MINKSSHNKVQRIEKKICFSLTKIKMLIIFGKDESMKAFTLLMEM